MRFERLQWLFPIAVTVHNSEEAIHMPKWVAAHGAQLPLHPAATRIWIALLILTIAAFAVTYLSAQRGKQSLWAYLQFGYIAAMLANVFLPHIPATFIYRGYTPGVVTAVLINLPLMSVLLFKAVRERWVSGRKALVYALLVPLAIAATIGALFTIPWIPIA